MCQILLRSKNSQMSLVLYYIYRERDIPSRKKTTQQLIISTLLTKKKKNTNKQPQLLYL